MNTNIESLKYSSLNSIITFGVTYLLISFKLNSYAVITIKWLISSLIGFFLQKKIFLLSESPSKYIISKYIIVSLIVLIINFVFIHEFTKTGLYIENTKEKNQNIKNLLIIFVIGIIIRYILYYPILKQWVFIENDFGYLNIIIRFAIILIIYYIIRKIIKIHEKNIYTNNNGTKLE